MHCVDKKWTGRSLAGGRVEMYFKVRNRKVQCQKFIISTVNKHSVFMLVLEKILFAFILLAENCNMF